MSTKPLEVASRSSPLSSPKRTNSGERARMTVRTLRPIMAESAVRPTANELSMSAALLKARAGLGLILLEQRRAPSPLLELARRFRLPQLCEAKSAQPYGDWGCPREGVCARKRDIARATNSGGFLGNAQRDPGAGRFS